MHRHTGLDAVHRTGAGDQHTGFGVYWGEYLR